MNGGLAAAILVGSGLAMISGQNAAAQAAEAEETQNDTVVQTEWQVDSVLADMETEWVAERAAREKAEAAQAAKEAEERAAAEAAAQAAAEQAAKEAEEQAAREAAEAAAAAEAAKPWMSPSKAAITSYYGMRDGRLHGGTDFANWTGDEIPVVGDGTVTYVGFEAGGYGNVVYVDHGDGIQTRYAHADSVPVSVGDKLSKGDTVIISGNTGGSTGPHLHFEVLINGEKVDSLAWLQEQGVDVG